MEKANHKYLADIAGERLDVFVSRQIASLSKRQAAIVCKNGLITVNGRVAKAGEILAVGDEINIYSALEPISARSEKGARLPALNVVLEDENVLIINKPRCIHSVTLKEDDPPTLADAIVYYCPTCITASPDPREGGLVQRLDYYTSGLVLAAKNRVIWNALRTTFQKKEVIKTYLALAQGSLAKDWAIISGFSGSGEMVRVRKETNLTTRTTQVENLKQILLPSGDTCSIVKATATGAYRHQIRAHLAHIGHPLVGDKLYGSSLELRDIPILKGNVEIIEGFLLHAHALKLKHPLTGRDIEVKANFPFMELYS